MSRIHNSILKQVARIAKSEIFQQRDSGTIRREMEVGNFAAVFSRKVAETRSGLEITIGTKTLYGSAAKFYAAKVVTASFVQT